MARKRFCKLVIIEGDEEVLRSGHWAQQIHKDGVSVYADGVNVGYTQISWEDVKIMNVKALIRTLKAMKEANPVILEDVE